MSSFSLNPKRARIRIQRCIRQQYQHAECMLMLSLYYFDMDQTDRSREWLKLVRTETSLSEIPCLCESPLCYVNEPPQRCTVCTEGPVSYIINVPYWVDLKAHFHPKDKHALKSSGDMIDSGTAVRWWNILSRFKEGINKHFHT